MQRARRESGTPSIILFYSLVFLVTIIDQITKFLVLHFLALGQTVPLIPNVFHLTLVHNTGIAFGMFQNYEALLFVMITLSLIILFVWGSRLGNASSLVRVALTLILGGALGNWIDRVHFGAVVDFLDFRVWPVFNIADSAISMGVFLFLFQFFFKSSSGKAVNSSRSG